MDRQLSRKEQPAYNLAGSEIYLKSMLLVAFFSCSGIDGSSHNFLTLVAAAAVAAGSRKGFYISTDRAYGFTMDLDGYG